MRFMMLIYPDKTAEQGTMPDETLIHAMMKYNEDLTKAGVLLALDGLHPSKKGARIRFGGGGKGAVIDGPFAESKEIIGGYWMIQVKSREEAIEWAKRVPTPPGAGEGMIELRQVFEASDFGPEIAEKESALMMEIGKGVAKNAKA
ncbi:MAG: hypothetical protein JWP91_2959 [Fibrobacteres bacterium]|nr:hypothetical protein [Fibrobacterota bacterium]